MYVKSMFKEIGIVFTWMQLMHWLRRDKKGFSGLIKIFFLRKDMSYMEVYICPQLYNCTFNIYLFYFIQNVPQFLQNGKKKHH